MSAIRTLVLSAALVVVVVLAEDELVLVESDFVPGRLRRRNVQAEWTRDLPIDDVIHAPLDNSRVFTKDSFYINTMGHLKKEAKMYVELLTEGKGTVEGIDAFFVTPPPQRTTIAPTRPTEDVPVVRVSHGSRAEQRRSLRLVSLPPPVPSPAPPFKHNSVRRRHIYPSPQSSIASNLTTIVAATAAPTTFPELLAIPGPPALQGQIAGPAIRFPAQAWQVPPMLPSTPSSLAALFATPTPVVPPNPFLSGLVAHQPTTAIVQPKNVDNPFVPIAVAEPPPLTSRILSTAFSGGTQPVAAKAESGHRTSLRIGSFARNQAATPIALPSGPSGSFDSAANEWKELEFSTFPYSQELLKKPPPVINYSVDSAAVIQKGDDYKPNAKIFISKGPRTNQGAFGEKPSENLRNFAKSHPQVINSLKRPMVFRGHEIVKPKSPSSSPGQLLQSWPAPIVPQQTLTVVRIPYHTSGQAPISALNPNAKLDLCCRKQRVSAVCQGLCNFDTFNDKSLVAAFLTNQCPGPQLGQAYECASSKADHTLCCERAGLHAFQAGKCMPFCQTHIATPSNVLDYFVCLQVRANSFRRLQRVILYNAAKT